jgi:hypothetical protein
VACVTEFCQKSLQGVFGRQRERFRGMVPREAKGLMPAELK